LAGVPPIGGGRGEVSAGVGATKIKKALTNGRQTKSEAGGRGKKMRAAMLHSAGRGRGGSFLSAGGKIKNPALCAGRDSAN